MFAALLIRFSLSLLVAAQVSAAVKVDDVSSQQALVEWVRENGGHFSSKLEFRRIVPGDATTPFGIFATQRIEKDELLMSMPSKCIISSDRDEDDESHNDFMSCASMHYFVDEAKKGEESFYAPYINYLKNQPMVQIPSTWSREAKDMLELILAANNNDGAASLLRRNADDAVNLIDEYWKGHCGGSDDPFELNMAMHYYVRSDNAFLVPLYDLLNHRNGRWHNTVVKTKHAVQTNELVSQDVFASRVIEKEEQIYNSYNMCAHEHACSEHDRKFYGANEFLIDYGFIEPTPQRWVFPNGIRFIMHEDDEGEQWAMWIPEESVTNERIEFLRSQLTRLEEAAEPQLRSLESKVTVTQSASNPSPGEKTIHPSEVRLLREFYEALTTAISVAIEAGIDVIEDESCLGGTCDTLHGYRYRDLYSIVREPHRPGYHPNIPYYDDWDVPPWSPSWEGFEMIDEIESSYQTITYMKHRDKEDYCFDLDHIIQICSNQRPHYHEVATHVPAGYFDTIRRAAFVGGGDSMILHEILKYPSIELIVGLELDQHVTRQSFKYFKAQPHFDDQRVQWWFGDAAKTLNLLPSDYFGSFDIVVVDLSETVASNSVTTGLNIIEALAQLLQPNGILIKNELYFEKMSEVFDYTAQIYFEGVPITYDWALAMGSNGVNFLNPSADALRKRPDIETHFYKLPRDVNSHLDIVHDFRRNDARAAGKCRDATAAADGAADETDKSEFVGGVLLVLEVENSSQDLDWNALEDKIVRALQRVGLSHKHVVARSGVSGRQHGVFLFSEGFVVARFFSEEKYVAFDVQLWGAFTAMANNVEVALSNVVGVDSDSLSSFRVITGGMRGASVDIINSTNAIGPRITQVRDCESVEPPAPDAKAIFIDQEVMDAALSEALNLVQDEEATIAVLCGEREKPCPALDVLRTTDTAIPIWTCSGVERAEFEGQEGLSSLLACEKSIFSALREAVEQHNKLSSLILDTTAHINMARIIDNIFSYPKNRSEILMPRFVVLASIPSPNETNVWRRNWLEWLRIELSEDELERRENEVFDGTVCRTEILMTATDKTFEIGMVSIGPSDPNCISRSVEAANAIESRTGVQTEIRRIDGSNEDCQDNTIKYWSTNKDYDQTAALKQAAGQRQLGAQRYSQLKVAIKNPKNIADSLARATRASLHANTNDTFVEVFNDLGDGVIVVGLCTESTTTVVWDGGDFIDANIFSYGSDSPRGLFDNMTEFYIDALNEERIEAEPSFYDEFPRGVGRIVNFPGPVKDRGIPCTEGSLCSYK